MLIDWSVLASCLCLNSVANKILVAWTSYRVWKDLRIFCLLCSGLITLLGDMLMIHNEIPICNLFFSQRTTYLSNLRRIKVTYFIRTVIIMVHDDMLRQVFTLHYVILAGILIQVCQVLCLDSMLNFNRPTPRAVLIYLPHRLNDEFGWALWWNGGARSLSWEFVVYLHFGLLFLEYCRRVIQLICVCVFHMNAWWDHCVFCWLFGGIWCLICGIDAISNWWDVIFVWLFGILGHFSVLPVLLLKHDIFVLILRSLDFILLLVLIAVVKANFFGNVNDLFVMMPGLLALMDVRIKNDIGMMNAWRSALGPLLSMMIGVGGFMEKHLGRIV